MPIQYINLVDDNNGFNDDEVLTRKCRVCGDKAIGFNYNVITCESCEAFFHRNAFRPKVFMIQPT